MGAAIMGILISGYNLIDIDFWFHHSLFVQHKNFKRGPPGKEAPLRFTTSKKYF